MLPSRVSSLFLFLLSLSLFSCWPKPSFSPNYIELIDQYGARPFENLIAIDKSQISDLRVYVSISPPTQYIRRWRGIDNFDIFFPGMLPALLLELPRKIDPDFNAKAPQYIDSMEFKANKNFQNQLNFCLCNRIRPQIKVAINHSSFKDSLSIPIFSHDEPPGIVILPPIKVDQPPNSGTTLLAFVSLHFYFSNLNDTKVTKPLLYIQGNGTLSVCSALSFQKYLEKYPMLKKKMPAKIPKENFKEFYYLDRKISEKSLEKFNKILCKSKVLDGFYVETFGVSSASYDQEEWLDPNKKTIEKELTAMLSRARAKVCQDLRTFFNNW